MDKNNSGLPYSRTEEILVGKLQQNKNCWRITLTCQAILVILKPHDNFPFKFNIKTAEPPDYSTSTDRLSPVLTHLRLGWTIPLVPYHKSVIRSENILHKKSQRSPPQDSRSLKRRYLVELGSKMAPHDHPPLGLHGKAGLQDPLLYLCPP